MMWFSSSVLQICGRSSTVMLKHKMVPSFSSIVITATNGKRRTEQRHWTSNQTIGTMWFSVVQRGYSWAEFESFIGEWECVWVGPFWINDHLLLSNGLNEVMGLGSLCFQMKPPHTDQHNDDVSSMLLPFLKLFWLQPENKRCWIHFQSSWWLPVMINQSEMIFDFLRIYKDDYIDATTLDLAATRTKELSLDDYCIVDTRNTVYPANHPRSIRIQILHLVHNNIDADLAAFIRLCTELNKLEVVDHPGRQHSSNQWIPFLTVCSGCQKLRDICIPQLTVEADAWLPGLTLLMHNQNISSIIYNVNKTYDSSIQPQRNPYSLKVSRTNTIAQALMFNKNLTSFEIPTSEIDETTYQSKVLPILNCNKIWSNIAPFCRNTLHGQSGMQLLGRLLCHRLLRQNPSFLFELVCEAHPYLAHMGMMATRNICSS